MEIGVQVRVASLAFSLKLSMKYMSPSMLVSEMMSGDKSNKKFLQTMRKDLQLEGM